MSEWWTYRPTSFLLFSPRTYYRTIELYNLAIWPAQIVGILVGVAIVALLIGRGGRYRDRILAALLALCWLWTAWAFEYQRYAKINWAAVWLAAAFALEGLLLAALGTVARRIVFEPASTRASRTTIALAALVILAYPLLAAIDGRSWTTSEVFGVAPDPTALATVPLLMLVRGRIRWVLLIVPLIACVISTGTLWAMKVPEAWVIAAIAVAAILVGAGARPKSS